MDRSEILQEAERLINGDRNQQYGSFEAQAHKLARMWSVIVGIEVTPKMVAPILICLKIVRMGTATDQDSEVDICGYAALHAEAFKKNAE